MQEWVQKWSDMTDILMRHSFLNKLTTVEWGDLGHGGDLGQEL